MKLEVFDPAMCCSTGVCGPSVDPALAAFAADLGWVASTGAEVRRYNLGQEPGAFAGNEQVRTLLQDKGEDALPVVFVDGEFRSSGRYPTRDELAGWAPTVARTVSLDVITELAAIGAAIGSNCEPCFKFHYDKARKLGLTKAELVVAVRAAQMVKDAPARNVLDLAAKLLDVDTATFVEQAVPAVADATSAPATGGCCGSAEASNAVASKSDTEAGGCCGGAAGPVAIGAAPAASRGCC